ncbi:MAG: hypothetical protein WCD88_16905 [Desulfobacterales bacterium]
MRELGIALVAWSPLGSGFLTGTVIADIKWNSHNISHLKVAGDEVNGFSLSLDINWKAKTYDDKNYDMNIHQDWEITVDKNRNFIIERLRAEVIDNK